MGIIDLTLDTNVLLVGVGRSTNSCQAACASILENLLDHPSAFLVLDCECFIDAEYERKVGGDNPGRVWLRAMAERNKIRRVPRGVIAKGVSVKLREAHFHPDDEKFVRTAMQTETKHLVSDEHGLTNNRIRKILRRIDVVVADSCEERKFRNWAPGRGKKKPGCCKCLAESIPSKTDA